MLQPTQAGEDLPLGEVPVKKHFAGQMTLSGNILYGQNPVLVPAIFQSSEKALKPSRFKAFSAVYSAIEDFLFDFLRLFCT